MNENKTLGDTQPRKDVFCVNGYEATVLVPPNANGKWIWKTEFFYAFDKSESDLYDKGYARVYYGISDKYGSPDAVGLMYGFYLELMKRYDLEKKGSLFGFSRGGLYAFNFALAHPECVAKIYLDAPVLDLRSWPRNDPAYGDEAFLHRQVMTEYGFASEEEFSDYRGYPVCRLKEFFALGLPTLLIAGDADATVSFKDNSDRMIRYAEENGEDLVYYVKVGADHHPHSFGNAWLKGGTDPDPETFLVYSSETAGTDGGNARETANSSSIVTEFIEK